MLLALEAKQRLVELLNAYVDGSQQEVRVVVGLDEASPAMQDLVLIGAPAQAGRRQSGHGGGDCTHPHPISGDDPGGSLRRRDSPSAFWKCPLISVAVDTCRNF